MTKYSQEISRMTWGPGFQVPRKSTLRYTELEDQGPNMTQGEFIQYCRTMTLNMIPDNVEIITEIDNGWAYVIFDPTNSYFIHITLKVRPIDELPFIDSKEAKPTSEFMAPAEGLD